MAGANRLHWPRRGSLQFWPRKRAKRIVPRVRGWAKITSPKLIGYLGYKAGMTHIQFKDNRPNAITKGSVVTFPATIIECPSLLPVALVFYKKIPNAHLLVGELYAEKLNKSIKKPKNTKGEPKDGDFDEIRLKIITQPKKTSMGKKNGDMFEIPLAGTPADALKHGKELLTKEIKVSDIFKEGQFIDAHAITKGKGFQGTVKRYGVKIRQHKSEKTKRGIGNLGAWTPKRVSWTVAQPGKMGFHQRTDYNKLILKIDSDPGTINPKGGLVRYGNVKNEYLLVKGSIPGAKKRPIVLTEPLRQHKHSPQIQIDYIHQESQQ
jgi:large subunit ribosomal protein L3